MSKSKIYSALFFAFLVCEVAAIVLDIVFFSLITGIILTVISLVNLCALLFYRLFPEIKGFKTALIYADNLILFVYFCVCDGVSYFGKTALINYAIIGVCLGTLCCVVEAKGFKRKIKLSSYIVTIACSGLLVFSMLSFINIRLDFSEPTKITAAVTDKSVDSWVDYSFYMTAENDAYGELYINVDYETSKAANIGGSIEITAKNGLLGGKYYYCENIRNKSFYHTFSQFFPGIEYFDEDDVFYNYVNSIEEYK